MRRLPIALFLIFLLTSCKEDRKVAKAVNAKTEINNNEPVKLTYYKCDYTKRFDTLFSSGNEHETDEVWGVSEMDINKFRLINIRDVDTTAMMRNAERHLKKRFRDINLELSDFQIQPINERDTLNERNRFAEITFLYDKRGYYQKVPMLLDGRIILSDSE